MNQPATLPPGLPPLPPVPPGFDRWEYRGKAWKTDQFARYAYLDKGGTAWGVHSREYIPLGISGTHYLEAVREPANEPAAGEPSGVEARACEDALAPFQRVARGIPDNWPGECILRFDQRADGSIFLSYHGTNDAIGGITIDQWRKLLPPTTEVHE